MGEVCFFVPNRQKEYCNMDYHLQTKDRVLAAVQSSEAGLTTAQAQARLERDGKNKLAEKKPDSLPVRFLKALLDPMILLLLGAAAVSTVTSILQHESFSDLFVILFVVIINTVLSVVQESKAEAAIGALMEMTAATSRVLRDGSVVTVKSEDLAVGDVVILEAGDAVPADCRVLESHSMKVEEAALTGESVPVNKSIDLLMLRQGERTIPLGDRVNMLYSGSTVAYGRGRAVVTAIGMDTEMGKIADALSQAAEEKTPLQKKLAALSVTLTKLVLGICVFVFAFGVIRDVFFSATGDSIFTTVLNTFIIAVALAVAAIPEGMPAVTTIILSIGVTAMSKRNALVRKLTAVETLGCTQIICSDKTGTLTQNRMTVVDQWCPKDTEAARTLLARAMALCTDATLEPGAQASEGEPTEAALVNYALSLGLPKYALSQQAPRVGEAPFDSGRKMMSTIHREPSGLVQYTKGATEILITHCDSYLENGQLKPMTEDFRAQVMDVIKGFAGRALRVLGAACREYDLLPDSMEAEDLEEHLTFIGVVGMIDPCRPEVYNAIQECRQAGIRPIMITGDHVDTAIAIARDLGILTEDSQAATGSDLEAMSDKDLFDAVERYSVYARVQPEHKTRIVRAWQAHGRVVAMTGDGVNDAPSIKSADIGIGMGITGTAVTKSVSDMVLADDNFATIVSAVEEGRKIYDNVRKVVQFQLATNFAEIVAIFLSSVLGLHILGAAHLLWINMVTDSAPGLALGMEKAEPGLMVRKPRPADESLFANHAGRSMVLEGTFMGLLIVASYFLGQRLETGAWRLAQSADGMTMAFLTCNFAEMFQGFCKRSLDRSLFTLGSRNWWLWGALAWTVLLTWGVLLIPGISALFGFTSISLGEFTIAMALAATVIPVSELVKALGRRRSRE